MKLSTEEREAKTLNSETLDAATSADQNERLRCFRVRPVPRSG